MGQVSGSKGKYGEIWVVEKTGMNLWLSLQILHAIHRSVFLHA
jgi:hypothetical protein